MTSADSTDLPRRLVPLLQQPTDSRMRAKIRSHPAYPSREDSTHENSSLTISTAPIYAAFQPQGFFGVRRRDLSREKCLFPRSLHVLNEQRPRHRCSPREPDLALHTVVAGRNWTIWCLIYNVRAVQYFFFVTFSFLSLASTSMTFQRPMSGRMGQ